MMSSTAFVAWVSLGALSCHRVSATTTTTAQMIDYSDAANWYCPIGSCLRRTATGNNPTDFECFTNAATGKQCGGGFLPSTTCNCVGEVKRGIYEDNLWTDYITSTSSIACTDSSFATDPASGRDKFCWCEFDPVVAGVSTAVATASQTGYEVATCIVESFCTNLQMQLVVDSLNAATSLQGMATMIWSDIITTAMAAAGSATIEDAGYALGSTGLLTRNYVKITPATTSALPAFLNALDLMDPTTAVSTYMTTTQTQLNAGGMTTEATMIGQAMAAGVTYVMCDDNAYGTTSTSTMADEMDSSSAPPMVAGRFVIGMIIGGTSLAAMRWW